MTAKNTLILLIAFLMTAGAQAKTYPHEGAQVQIDIPDGWKVDSKKDEMEAHSKDDKLALFFAVFPATKVDKAMGEIEKEIKSHVTDLKENDDLKKIEHEGMVGAAMTATGKVEGEAVTIGVVMFETKAKKVVFMMAFAKSSDWEKKGRIAEKVFKTLRPLKK